MMRRSLAGVNVGLLHAESAAWRVEPAELLTEIGSWPAAGRPPFGQLIWTVVR
jgi:hypothetical protein